LCLLNGKITHRVFVPGLQKNFEDKDTVLFFVGLPCSTVGEFVSIILNNNNNSNNNKIRYKLLTFTPT